MYPWTIEAGDGARTHVTGVMFVVRSQLPQPLCHRGPLIKVTESYAVISTNLLQDATFDFNHAFKF
jgi:hypothetical protein